LGPWLKYKSTRAKLQKNLEVDALKKLGFCLNMPHSIKKPVKCGILFDSESPPASAYYFFKQLTATHGEKNIHWLRARRTQSPDKISGISLWENQNSTPEQNLLDLQFDFVLLASPIAVPNEWIAGVRHGVWFFRYGASRSGETFGVKEMQRTQTIQEVSLEKLTSGAERILKTGRFKTNVFSMKQHRDSILSQCAVWISSLANEISLAGKVRCDIAPAVVTEVTKSSHRIVDEILVFLSCKIRKIKKLLFKSRRFFTYSEWNVGLVTNFRQVIPNCLNQLKPRWLLEPKWPIFYADPFIGSFMGQPCLAVERYSYLDRKGEITMFPVHGSTVSSQESATLDFPFHASYPCLVEDQNSLFCIPETLDTNEIAIYRCHEFPSGWRKTSTVVQGTPFSDPTCFRHGDRWWLLATAYDAYSEGNTQLYAWYADDLNGTWTGHVKNPIKSDVGGSRSAGTPFQIDGVWYRPTQDCSVAYGKSIAVQKIVELTKESFREEFSFAIVPEARYPDACHHFAVWGDNVLVDGRRDRYSLSAALANIGRIKSAVAARLSLRHVPETFLHPALHEMELSQN
jgi:hypothetical protein